MSLKWFRSAYISLLKTDVLPSWRISHTLSETNQMHTFKTQDTGPRNLRNWLFHAALRKMYKGSGITFSRETKHLELLFIWPRHLRLSHHHDIWYKILQETPTTWSSWERCTVKSPRVKDVTSPRRGQWVQCRIEHQCKQQSHHPPGRQITLKNSHWLQRFNGQASCSGLVGKSPRRSSA